jgi:ectoine hydroxylase-related dioxygenase (phytanoyl-CoA dioxygenase family)
MADRPFDVTRYRQEGYAVLRGVLGAEECAEARREADRLRELCGAARDRYAARLELEVDHLAAEQRKGMDEVIRKIEPISDLSPFFDAMAQRDRIADPARAVFEDDVRLFEDKLNLKLPGGSPYPWHQDWACCWRAHTDELVTSAAVPVPLAAGDMIVFDPYLLHFSDLNRGTTPRRAIIYTYYPARLGAVNQDRFPADHAIPV